jgi:TRAP-type C4-dicarboxylate transport system substrate-binding protein
MLVMSKKAWDQLPADLQSILDQVFLDYEKAYIDGNASADSQWVDQVKKLGMDPYSFTPEDLAKIQALAAPIVDAWVAEWQPKGYPAQEMIDRARELIKTYGYK